MLRDEILAKYVDGNGLVSPLPVGNPPMKRASDNGILFTSEFYSLLLLRGESSAYDAATFLIRQASCVQAPGLLCRAPGDTGQEGPDDYYGVFCTNRLYNLTAFPTAVIDRLWANWGFLNNLNPDSIRSTDGTINWDAFLIRQIPLVCAAYSAARLSRWYHFPFYVLTAIIITFSNITDPLTDSNDRLLVWNLIHTVKDDSLWCKLASKIWTYRLLKNYGVTGIRAVATLYFGPNHPFSSYFIN
jgi:hypothetical protein